VRKKENKTKKYKRICSEASAKKSGGIHGVSPEEEKEGCGGKDLEKRKVLRLE